MGADDYEVGGEGLRSGEDLGGGVSLGRFEGAGDPPLTGPAHDIIEIAARVLLPRLDDVEEHGARPLFHGELEPQIDRPFGAGGAVARDQDHFPRRATRDGPSHRGATYPFSGPGGYRHRGMPVAGAPRDPPLEAPGGEGMLRLHEPEPRASENGHQAKRPVAIVDSYHRLADVFHHVLSEQSLDTLLERIADALGELVPYDTITIYRADEEKRNLRPVLARDRWEKEILNNECAFGEGLTGWAVQHRGPLNVPQIHLDPRASHIPGTPEDEPEALVSVPLIARGAIKGALNLYRLGEQASFSEEEFELAVRFGDAAALAIDNAESREQLERQAQSDALTGLLNHRAFHERLRAELGRASRSREPVAVLMLDVDDFKRTNDIYGHATGDHVLVRLAELLTATVRVSDVVCRVGGEEFAVVMAGCNVERAFALARRIERELIETTFDPAGRLTVSIGVAEAPRHAMNPRDLAACAELAMMTAKARGAGEIVLFDPDDVERPDPGTNGLRDARSIAHLKLLQSLVGRLNRLNDVREIGATIVSELRTLIDYHNGRVYLAEGDDLVPIAFRGDLGAYGEESEDVLACKIGEGITGHVAATGRSALIENALRASTPCRCRAHPRSRSRSWPCRSCTAPP